MAQTKDRLRIIEGDKALSKPFAFRKHVEQYKKQYIQNRRIDGKVVLFNTLTQKPTTEEEIRKAVIKAVTGSDTPMKDLRYLNAKRNLKIARNIGNLEDGLSINDIKYNIRRLFSPILYDNEGKQIGRVYDANVEEKLNLFENKIKSEYFPGTSYERAETKERAKTLLDKDKNKPIIIDLPNGGTTKVFPNHPKYEEFKKGTLGINDLTLPDEMTKIGGGGTPVGGSDYLNLAKKQGVEFTHTTGGKTPVSGSDYLNLAREQGVEFTYKVNNQNQVVTEKEDKTLTKDKAPAMHWADEILKKYPKSWLKSRVGDIDRAYPGFNKLAKQRLLLNPITQLELEAQ